MIKDIQQTEIPLNKGIVRTPSVGSDGELSECVGLIPHAGELRVIDNPAPTSVELPEGAVLVFVDRVSGGDNYIYSIGGKLGYIRVKDSQIGSATEIDTSALEYTEKLPVYSDKYAISSVGNSLIVTGPRFGYLQWKGENYRALAGAIPQVRLRMGLTRGLARYLITGSVITIEKNSDTSATYVKLVSAIRYAGTVGSYGSKEVGINYTLKGGHSYQVTAYRNDNGYPLVFFYLLDSNGNIIKESGGGLTLTTDILGGEYSGCKIKVENLSFDPVDYDISFHVYESSTAGGGLHLKRDQDTLTSLNGVLNAFVNKMHKENKFVYPFFVRYALRLYDGSVANPSEPCLMVPNSGPTPRLYFNFEERENARQIQREAFAVASEMFFDLDDENAGKIESLKTDWSGIVKEIVFYVSPPVYTYDQSVTAESKESRLPTVIEAGSDDNYTYTAGEGWGSHVDDIFKRALSGASPESVFSYALLPPTFDPEYLAEQYRNKGNFYEVYKVSLEKIKTEKNNGYYQTHSVPVEVGLEPEILLTQPRLEEVFTPEAVLAGKSFTYNNRAMLYNLVKKQNPSGNYYPIYQNGTPNTGVPLDIFVYLDTDEGEKIIEAGETKCWPFFWWYWPDSRAKKIVLRGKEGDRLFGNTTCTFYLKPHDFLPGSYWFGDMRGSDNFKEEHETRPTFVVSDVPYDYYPNKVYTSEADNPFVFKATAVRTMPSNLVGMVSAAKALSEGQFGQFPVYAFCEDGIWAMAVTNEGYLSPAQAIARDIVTNPDSITQLDGAVAFVTPQGLMQIEGSNVTPLSLGMEGRNLDESFIGEAIQKFFGKNYVADTGLFADQVQNCKVLYDYSNQLLHLFGEGTRHYVYSRRDGQWAAQILDKEPISVVPGYPLSTLQLGNKLYQYAKHTSAPLQEGFALTRSLTLGNPLSRKMIADIRAIGLRTSSDTIRRIAIYGSHDNQNWFPVKSLKSGSAKYYRFLVMARMIDTDTLTGIACRYQERYGHKLR